MFAVNNADKSSTGGWLNATFFKVRDTQTNACQKGRARVRCAPYLGLTNNGEIEITMAPKWSGSENMSFLSMLNPSDGRKGIKKFVDDYKSTLKSAA